MCIRDSYGAALQYFTGSKMHNVALRQRAIKRGLTLNEYALLRLEDNTIVAAANEQDIYRALELDYIPPELRENGGEIEAAAASFVHADTGTLPHLITLADIRGEDVYKRQARGLPDLPARPAVLPAGPAGRPEGWARSGCRD